MLSAATWRHRFADRVGDLLGAFLHRFIMICTAMFPSNGRSHIRSVAFDRTVTSGIRRYSFRGTDVHLLASYADYPAIWYESETIDWLENFLKDGEILWDIGANVGLYTVWAARRFPNAKVVAVEPNALTYPILVRNVILNGCADRVFTLPIAMSDQDAGLQFFRLSGLIPGSGYNQLAAQSGPPMAFGGEAARHSVISLSLDSAVSLLRVAPPHHVKIDIDGLEPLVLRGATKTLAYVQSVLVEIDEQRFPFYERGELDIRGPLNEAGLFEDNSFLKQGSGRMRLFVRRK